MYLDLILILAGLCAGFVSGVLGIGGGSIIIPIMLLLGYSPLNAIATSSFVIAISSAAGSVQNWRMGHFNKVSIILMGIPAVFTAAIGAAIAKQIPEYLLLLFFGSLMSINIYLLRLKQRIAGSDRVRSSSQNLETFNALIGGIAGFVAGLVGVGGGAIMVPLQMLILGKNIKTAIHNSLAVIAIAAISATISHTIQNNILLKEGLYLGFSGLVGVQFGTHLLSKLPDRIVTSLFCVVISAAAIQAFHRSWLSFISPHHIG